MLEDSCEMFSKSQSTCWYSWLMMQDIEKEPEVAGIFSQYFEEASFPAATIIGVADLPIIEGKQALVSMEAFVALP